MTTPLAAIIERQIRLMGPIRIADYMALALGHPRHGFYQQASPIGAAGAFVTAPEVSQMFGEMIALWLIEGWRSLGRPDPFALVELGPGRGTLMADILRAGRVEPGFVAAAQVVLVETSSALRAEQAAALADHRDKVDWVERIDLLPGLPALVVANEFFDALPIRQFQRTPHGWAERVIGLSTDGGGFSITLAEAGPLAAALVPPALVDAMPPAVVEVSPSARAAMAELSRHLVARGGLGLIIDYGAEVPREGSTWQAVSGHRKVDPLAAPGEADLTAHVDFWSLAAAARAEGATSWGPVHQGVLLQRLGIAERARALSKAADPSSVARDLARLIGDDQMGTLFKALAVASPGLTTPAGFDPP